MMDEVKGWLSNALTRSALNGWRENGNQDPVLAHLEYGTPHEKKQAEDAVRAMIPAKLASHQVEALVEMREAFVGRPQLQTLFTPAHIQDLAKLIQNREQDDTQIQESIELFRRLCGAVRSNAAQLNALHQNIIGEFQYLALSGRGQDLVNLEAGLSTNRDYHIDTLFKGLHIYPVAGRQDKQTPGSLLFKKNAAGKTEVCIQFDKQPPITDTQLFLEDTLLDRKTLDRVFPALREVRDNSAAPTDVRRMADYTYQALTGIVGVGNHDFDDAPTMPLAHLPEHNA